jgi:uncharacterized membrane protein YdjX (TVP38/TMEM64 family)
MIKIGKQLCSIFSKDKSYFLFLLIFAVMPLIVSSFIIVLFQEKQDLINNDFYSIVLFYIIATFTMTFALTPTLFIAVISGFYFSWYGLLGVLIAYPTAAVTGLLLGRLLMRVSTKRDYFDNQKLRDFSADLSASQLPLLIFCRLSPLMPFAMTNIAMARMEISWINYIAGTMIGMFPRTFLFFLAGKNTKEILLFIENPNKNGVQAFILPVLIMISAVGLYAVLHKKVKRIRLMP